MEMKGRKTRLLLKIKARENTHIIQKKKKKKKKK